MYLHPNAKKLAAERAEQLAERAKIKERKLEQKSNFWTERVKELTRRVLEDDLPITEQVDLLRQKRSINRLLTKLR